MLAASVAHTVVDQVDANRHVVFLGIVAEFHAQVPGRTAEEAGRDRYLARGFDANVSRQHARRARRTGPRMGYVHGAIRNVIWRPANDTFDCHSEPATLP